MSNAIEQEFNYALGEVLRSTTARWRANRQYVSVERTDALMTARNLRPDILVHDAWSPPFVIECSFQQRDAEKDAASRLGLVAKRSGLPIKTAFAIYAPAVFRSMSLNGMKEALGAGTEIRYAVYQRSRINQDSRWPSRGFISGTVHDLAALLPAAALHKEDIEAVAKRVAALLENAANELAGDLPEHVQQDFIRQVYQRSPLAGLRTIMVLWLDAALTRSLLYKHEVPGTGLARDPDTSQIVPSEHVRCWSEILARNWRPIFKPAVSTLKAACDSHSRATAKALDWIEKAREIIEVSNLGLHINVGAELFPLLSEDRKEAAAFYTQPSTSELLAHLTLQYEFLEPVEWGNARLFAKRRLADLTCGTGTLLRAGYRRIMSFHERAGGTSESCKEFHRVAIEHGLVGADVSPIAAHLTSSSLAALGTGEPYRESHICWLNVGGEEGRTGSLEYFKTDELRDLFGTAGGISSGIEEGNSPIVGVPNDFLDWILMNPPYSRTRGGQSAFDIAGLTAEERKACQNRWAKLVKSEQCSNKAGMAASFLALARRKIKPGGRIGFVLPLSAALADSWAITRRMIELEFDDVLAVAVVAGKALGKDAFSADTHMEEMLLVGTRKRDLAASGKPSGAVIHCVTLNRPPTRMGEAGEIARAVYASSRKSNGNRIPIRLGGDEIGQLYALQTDGTGSPWSPVGALHLDLMQAALDLSHGKLVFSTYAHPLGPPMSTVDELFRVGPTHDLIGHPIGGDGRGAFELHPVQGPLDAIGRDRSLWAASGATQEALIVSPTHKGYAPKGVGSEELRHAIRQDRSTVFYAKSMRWTSQKLVVATTTRAVLGGRSWASLGHKDGRVRMAFALWANSTLGMLVHWTRGQRTQTGRSTAQIGAVKKIPCPQLDQLPEKQLDYAATSFERLKDCVLLPACQAHVDDVRKGIDRAVLKIFGLENEDAVQTVDTLRLLWCREPSVHGGNKAALRLLRGMAGR